MSIPCISVVLMKGAVQCEGINASEHILLCEELKHLYTAITRCRKNLVFFDSDPVTRAPFFKFLKSQGLANLSEIGDNSFQKWSVDSGKNTKAWIARGQDFLDCNELQKAKSCFEKADSPVWTAVSEAKVGNQLPEEHSKYAPTIGIMLTKSSGEANGT